METTQLYESPLLEQFHEFYSEIIRQKKLVKQKPFHEALINVPEDVQSDKAAVDPVYNRLLSILERQVAQARSRGGEYGVAFYREAQYVMSALADEIFIHMDWEGRHAWKSNLLEYRLFGTHNAGDLFFTKVDKLLKANDPAATEMAAIYLQALSLGFRGKYRDMDDKGMLEFYHRQLFKIIFQRDADLENEKRYLFKRPYSQILDSGKKEKIPYFRWWGIILFLLVIIYLLISFGVWQNLTGDIQDITKRIISDFH